MNVDVPLALGNSDRLNNRILTGERRIVSMEKLALASVS